MSHYSRSARLNRTVALAISAGLVLTATPAIAPTELLNSAAVAATTSLPASGITALSILNNDKNTTVQSGGQLMWNSTLAGHLEFAVPAGAQPGQTWTITTTRGFVYSGGLNGTIITTQLGNQIAKVTTAEGPDANSIMTITLLDGITKEEQSKGQFDFTISPMSFTKLSHPDETIKTVYPLKFTVEGTTPTTVDSGNSYTIYRRDPFRPDTSGLLNVVSDTKTGQLATSIAGFAGGAQGTNDNTSWDYTPWYDYDKVIGGQYTGTQLTRDVTFTLKLDDPSITTFKTEELDKAKAGQPHVPLFSTAGEGVHYVHDTVEFPAATYWPGKNYGDLVPSATGDTWEYDLRKHAEIVSYGKDFLTITVHDVPRHMGVRVGDTTQIISTKYDADATTINGNVTVTQDDHVSPPSTSTFAVSAANKRPTGAAADALQIPEVSVQTNLTVKDNPESTTADSAETAPQYQSATDKQGTVKAVITNSSPNPAYVITSLKITYADGTEETIENLQLKPGETYTTVSKDVTLKENSTSTFVTKVVGYTSTAGSKAASDAAVAVLVPMSAPASEDPLPTLEIPVEPTTSTPVPPSEGSSTSWWPLIPAGIIGSSLIPLLFPSSPAQAGTTESSNSSVTPPDTKAPTAQHSAVTPAPTSTQAAPAKAAKPSKVLANTGASVLSLIAVAVLAMAAGATMLLRKRRF